MDQFKKYENKALQQFVDAKESLVKLQAKVEREAQDSVVFAETMKTFAAESLAKADAIEEKRKDLLAYKAKLGEKVKQIEAFL